jgi:hypothetical protein
VQAIKQTVWIDTRSAPRRVMSCDAASVNVSYLDVKPDEPASRCPMHQLRGLPVQTMLRNLVAVRPIDDRQVW